MFYIYKITNCINGRIYVGQTRRTIEQRFLQHSKSDTPLGNAMRDCGIENFTVEVIETCETPEQAREREIFWIRVLKSRLPGGYNQSDGGEGFRKVVHRVSPQKVISNGNLSICDALKRFRKVYKLTQPDVAKVLGVTAQAYGRYETGKSSISAEDILKISDHYNVSPEYLLGRIDTPKLEPPKPAADPRAEQFYQMFQSMLNTAVNRPPAS